MLTGTAISSDTSMSHKYSPQWVARLQIAGGKSSTGMLQRPCCRVCIQQINICMQHQRSSGSKASIRSNKVCTKTVFPGEAARPSWLKCSLRLAIKHTITTSICIVVKISVAVAGCWHVFKTALVRSGVWSKRRRARDPSSTVVDLKGHTWQSTRNPFTSAPSQGREYTHHFMSFDVAELEK